MAFSLNYAPERRLAVSVIFWTTDGYGPEKAGAAICALMRTRPHNALTTAKARVHDERLPSKLRRKPNEAHGEIHGELTDADFNRLTARGCPNRKSAGSDTRFWTINKISRRYDNLPASFHYSWPTAVMHDSRPLAQGNARRWPAQDGCAIGRLCYLEVVYASDVLDNAVADIVPNIDAEGEVSLGLHRGQIRLDWPAPRVIYTPCCCVA